MTFTNSLLVKRRAGLVAAACLAAIAAPAQATDGVTTPLMAGQHYVAGTVTCTLGSNEISGECVYTTAPGSDWCISEAHLWVGLTTPTKGAPGQFPFGAMTTCASSLIVPFNLRQIGVPTCKEGAKGYVFAAHAVLHSQTYGTQTGWGKGVKLPVKGGGWAMSFVEACAIPGGV